jgi:hypothetical protein
VMMQNRRKDIPVYVFDEHNEAYYYWHKAKYEGFINEPLDLFHVDAHSDMMQADVIQTSIYFPNDSPVGYLEYYHNLAKNEFNIGNFIIPAILNGLIKNVYFIFPKWKNYQEKRQKNNISSMLGAGKIFKHCLTINKHTGPTLLQALPDFKHYHYFFLPLERVPKARKVILDIDLDYFACRDSGPPAEIFTLEITQEQFRQQGEFLRDEALKAAGLDVHFLEREGRFYALIAPKAREDAAKSHLPSKPEIIFEIDRLIRTLQAKKIRLSAVTICRSCSSGFCPPDYGAFIEAELLPRLLFFLGN